MDRNFIVSDSVSAALGNITLQTSRRFVSLSYEMSEFTTFYKCTLTSCKPSKHQSMYCVHLMGIEMHILTANRDSD